MMVLVTTDLRYPIGPEPPFSGATAEARAHNSGVLAALPGALRAAVLNLTDEQLDTPYRPAGWTVRQVVHHLADSHINAFVRLKLALTEETPVIKPYDEEAWARLPDSRLELAPSLALLEGLHARWVHVVATITAADFGRTFYHPERREEFTVDHHLHVYAWHSRHHLAHVTELRRRERW
jgi:hypothetical protein